MGGSKLEALSVDLMMPYLFGLDRSGRRKNRFLEILEKVLQKRSDRLINLKKMI